MALKKVFDFGDVFTLMNYSAGEPHVRLNGEMLEELKNGWFRPFIVVDARNWNDLMTVRIGNQILMDNQIRASFVIPYLPFARHDRKNDSLDSFPLKFVGEVLGGLHFITVDPHSDVSGVFSHYPQSEVVRLFDELSIFTGNAMVAIPDAGATKKTYTWLGERDSVQCLKTRDPKTGKLSGFAVVNPNQVIGRNVVIIDDICDGGGTFLGLADQLRAAGAKSLTLGVTHGLFTKGISVIQKSFEKIYTLDTGSYKTDPRLITASVEKLIMEGTYL